MKIKKNKEQIEIYLFFILIQQFLQKLASFSFKIQHLLHTFSLGHKFIIFVDSIKIITVIVDKIVTSIGQRNIKNDANIFEIGKKGTISQYHTVVIVTTHHHKVAGIEENTSLFQKLNSK